MRKLSLSMLAAGTLLIAGTAAAQPGPGAHAGATWRGGGMMGGNVQMRGPNMQMRGPNMGGGMVRTGGYQMHGGQMHGGGNVRFHRWGPNPGPNFRYGRLRRGGFINSYWFAPQFYVGNWGAYGFSAPRDDQRWVRYYDDAYLVDGDGRVMDTRYGVRWDRYGEEWDNQNGIPGYRGEWRDYDDDADDEGDYREREDYADMREDMRGGDMRDEMREDMRGDGDMRDHHMEMRRREMHGGGDMRRHGEMMRHPGGPMMPPPGYGPGGGGYTNVYGGYGGYGAYAYPIVVETVTTTGGGGYIEEVTEEVVQTAHRRRAVRPQPRCSCAPAPRPVVRRPAPRPVYHRPRPPAGERG
jgi:Ni/Co efflux regulator RcnB